MVTRMVSGSDVVAWLDEQVKAQGILEKYLDDDNGSIGVAGVTHGEIHVYGIRKICELLGLEPVVRDWDGNKFGYNNNIVYIYWNGYKVFELEDKKDEK